MQRTKKKVKPAGLLLLLMLLLVGQAKAQDIYGHWKTVDDETGKAKSIVEIYQEDGKVYGKIIELLDPPEPNPLCTECGGELKDAPIIGLQIINGLSKDGDEYNDGRILDPNNGKTYKCYITLEDDDTLKVRGYVGFSLLGRTQYWIRESR